MEVAGRLAALGDTRAAQELPVAVLLSLRIAASRLAMNEKSAASQRSVVDLLWELALFIEDGSLSMAERRLRDLQQELRRALEEGAQDQELERLMEELAASHGRVPGRAHPAGVAAGPAGAVAGDAAVAGRAHGRPPRVAGDARTGRAS